MQKAPFSVFGYSSHLEYFQDAYEALHGADPAFSYDRIAQSCEFKSRTQARNFIKGIQKPTLAQLRKLSACFGLGEEEQEYVACLHQFQAVQGSPAAYEVFQRLAQIQKRNLPGEDPFREIQITASVLHMTLLSVFGMEDPPQHPSKIAEILKGRYTADEIGAAILELEKFGHIRLVEGKWKLEQTYIKNYDFKPSFFLRDYHRQALDIVNGSVEGAPDERYLVGASFTVNSRLYPRMIQKINAFVENLMRLEGTGGPCDMVVQLTTQLVRMTEIPETSKKDSESLK